MLIRRAWPARPTFAAPQADFDQVRREMLRWFDSLAGEGGEAVSAGVFPPVNVTEDEDHVHIRAEIPGIDPEQLAISALRNRVSIEGRREIAQERERVSYHRKERAEGSFSRAVTLPVEVQAERVEARYVDGILSLTLPKSEAAKPRQITVKS